MSPLLRHQAIPVSDPQAGLRLTEIFYSLQGEALTSGLPTIFVRLTGCPLRCVYCDTTYSFSGGKRHSIEDIMTQIAQYPCMRVCVTGGEPLAQPNAIVLMQRLLDAGYEISLETAGALSVQRVPTPVSKVMDIKTPSSGEAEKNLWSNLNYLTQHDQLKLVIMNREDYEWAKAKLYEYQLHQKVATVWFSPMFNIDQVSTETGDVPILARQLAEWILEDALPVRFQLQLHKIIWADAKGK
ncbi:7-carboxy-7-deazaguanine synthase QueE [Psychrobacter sp. I-STPA6b]|uniref:7-carboxy-7-deazaguanine synthase QueE n=1 Tax=Psychrobacter sp. I-STPA6b TaxID=2585718 RepID=UPI001D0C3C4F|nr:7-carboxy-7-deazaguanine synthase QueE [Psychrobacter sp. I-STPA6b]